MKETIYIIATKTRIKSKVYKNYPPLEANEIAIRLNLLIPDKLFGKPALEANIAIDDKRAEQIGIIEELEVSLENLRERERSSNNEM